MKTLPASDRLSPKANNLVKADAGALAQASDAANAASPIRFFIA
jgi:hypothetical protein